MTLTRYYVIPSDISRLYGDILTGQRSITRHYSAVRKHFGIPVGRRPTVFHLAEYEDWPVDRLAQALGLVAPPRKAKGGAVPPG
jgi:hypothetical protein